jgi:hypothetical protein
MSARLFACSIRLLARLYFSLSCALNTGSLHLKLRSFISIRSVSADTVVLFMPLFLICLLFIFILFLRTGGASPPCAAFPPERSGGGNDLAHLPGQPL